jgi:subtilisin family serine protease
VKGYAKQWFARTIRLNEAFAAAGTRGLRKDNGQPVIVAVLDTGIDLNHPAFTGRLVAPADRWDFVDNDNDPSEVGVLRTDPVYGHGTHVAGIVAMMVPDAKIMPIRILNRDGSGELWRITAGLIWAANHGADVVNLSIGYPQNVRLLHDLLRCNEVGESEDGSTFPELIRPIAVSVASGNGGGITPVYPAAEARDAMLAVGASTRNDRLAAFSTYDKDWVFVTAPGENIVSALPGSRYGVWSGTSMAAPIVAGLAALLKAQHPGSSPFEKPADIMVRIKNTSVADRYQNLPPWGDVRLNRVDALCAVTNITCPLTIAQPAEPGFEQFLVK